MVAVENHDEFAVGHRHCMIDVACFGVVMFFTLDVARTHFIGKCFKGVAAAVVQKVDAKLVSGPVEV